MGVITKLLYRANDLKKGKYHHLFLDMEENIHIHYRDLRIELSRNEFEDISATFLAQAKELLQIIQDTDYADGKLANANQDDTRIWTESKLKHEVVYHPERISIEECTDGFHLHLRNYKILFDEDDFQSLLSAFQQIDLNQPYAEKFDEIVELLYANDLHFILPPKSYSSRSNRGQKEIIVADYHLLKIKTIFEKIGLIRLIDNEYRTETGLKLILTSLSYQEILAINPEGVSQPQIYLSDFLSNNDIDHELLNQLQCQVLNTFNQAKQNNLAINMDFHSWRYKSYEKEIVFPKQPRKEENPAIAYRHWTDFLKQNDYYFKKPTKILFEKSHQEELYNQITNRLIENLVPNPVIAKIYIMGSAARMEMGYYKQPFVHGSWAKLGSDIDLLLEIDETQGEKIPKHWRFINQSKTNLCDIYHIDEIKLEDKLGFQEKYSQINFFHHLFDAYVYFPSKAKPSLKDAFLDKFSAKLIYSKKPSKTENSFHQKFKEAYGDDVKNIAKLNVATENELYRFQLNDKLWVLKCYKVSGNYSSSRLKEHVLYEVNILDEVKKRNLPAIRILNTLSGKSIINVEGNSALAYSYLQGKLFSYPDPDYPVEVAAKTLAQFHSEQIKSAFRIECDFDFDGVFDMWHPQYFRYANEMKNDKNLSVIFKSLQETYAELSKNYINLKSRNGLNWLHNHGDLTPRNFIFIDDLAYLFDFQNAFYGPRLFDIVDAAFEFCFGGKFPERNNFNRFERFINAYVEESELTEAEDDVLEDTIKLVGIIKFLKEVRMIKGEQDKQNLRRLRAISLGNFIIKNII